MKKLRLWFVPQWIEKKVWPSHRWVIIVGLVVFWVLWSSALTNFFDQNTICELDTAVERYKVAKLEVERIQAAVEAGIPQSVNDASNGLAQALEQENKAEKVLNAAGSKAWRSVIIILLGVFLQVITAWGLWYIFAELFRRKSYTLKSSQIEELEDNWTKSSQTEKSKNHWTKFNQIEKLKDSWTERIKSGRILQNEEKILSSIRENRDKKSIGISTIDTGKSVADEYRDMLLAYSQTNDTPPWNLLSKLLYKMLRVMKWLTDSNQHIDEIDELEKAYREVRKIVDGELARRCLHYVIPPFFFAIFYGMIGILSIRLANPAIREYLRPWFLSVMMLNGAVIAGELIHVYGRWGIYWLTEKTWSDLDDLIASVIVGPLSATIIATIALGAVNYKLYVTPQHDLLPLLQWLSYLTDKTPIAKLIIIIIATWLAVFFLNKVVIWSLDRWAKRTSQQVDDLFVKIIQVFGSFIVIAVGIGALLAAFSGLIRESTGVDSILLPYSIVVSVFSAILGYASREGFENFFGGLLLQIEKPFERNERIKLPDGTICDVVQVGMRSTVLYNVLENTEISVPNSEMSKMIITNISRPDLELRISISIWLQLDAYQSRLREVETILLDIAYLEDEIDQMRVTKGELKEYRGTQLKKMHRVTVEEELRRLANSHPEIQSTFISRIVGGGKDEVEWVFHDPYSPKDASTYNYESVLNAIANYREEYRRIDDNLRDIVDKAGQAAFTSMHATEANQWNDKMSRRLYRALEDFLFARNTESRDKQLVTEIANRYNFTPQVIKKTIEEIANRETNKSENKNNSRQIVREMFSKTELERRHILLQIGDEFGRLSSYVFAISEQYPTVRPELSSLISEISKEPRVFSEYTAQGKVKVTLHCYTLYLERHFEVIHKLNRHIQRRFSQAEIDDYVLNESDKA